MERDPDLHVPPQGGLQALVRHGRGRRAHDGGPESPFRPLSLSHVLVRGGADRRGGRRVPERRLDHAAEERDRAAAGVPLRPRAGPQLVLRNGGQQRDGAGVSGRGAHQLLRDRDHGDALRTGGEPHDPANAPLVVSPGRFAANRVAELSRVPGERDRRAGPHPFRPVQESRGLLSLRVPQDERRALDPSLDRGDRPLRRGDARVFRDLALPSPLRGGLLRVDEPRPGSILRLVLGRLDREDGPDRPQAPEDARRSRRN